MAKEELKKTGTTDISTRLASFEDLPTGFEDTDAGSFATPFLSIIQSNSPQVLEDSDSYIEGAKPGMFMNTLTSELYGKTIDLVDFKTERVYIEWKPDLGGFVGVHSIKEGEALSHPTAKFGERIGRESDNEFVETHVHYVLNANKLKDGPLIFNLASTGIKHSKKWMSNAKMLRLPNEEPAPLFSSIYRLTTALNEGEKWKWYQIGNKDKTMVERLDWVSDEQLDAAVAAIELFSDTSKLSASFAEEEEKKDSTHVDEDTKY